MEYARWMNEHPIGTMMAGQEACQALRLPRDADFLTFFDLRSFQF